MACGHLQSIDEKQTPPEPKICNHTHQEQTNSGYSICSSCGRLDPDNDQDKE